ncbi:MAG: DUF6763 family protein [Pseudomonadota bacterium]
MTEFVPRIGSWYQDLDTRALFEIVAHDREQAAVQVQYLDGEIADFDIEIWAELSLAAAAAPEDWRSAFELDEENELDPDAALHPTQWVSPVFRIEPDTIVGVEDY